MLDQDGQRNGAEILGAGQTCATGSPGPHRPLGASGCAKGRSLAVRLKFFVAFAVICGESFSQQALDADQDRMMQKRPRHSSYQPRAARLKRCS